VFQQWKEFHVSSEVPRYANSVFDSPERNRHALCNMHEDFKYQTIEKLRNKHLKRFTVSIKHSVHIMGYEKRYIVKM
jgi:hypothetical protein